MMPTSSPLCSPWRKSAAHISRRRFPALFHLGRGGHAISADHHDVWQMVVRPDLAMAALGGGWVLADLEAPIGRTFSGLLTFAPYCVFEGAPGSTAATPSGLMLKARKVKGSPPGFPHWC